MNAIVIRKAERRKAKLRLALIGPTGSGKTFSAIQLAVGLGGKIGLIDSENGSGDLYANVADYDIIPLEAPYTVQKYRDAIRAFEAAGYATIIIDSLTHAWAGEGGLLDKSSQLEKSGKVKNSFAAWKEITPEQNRLIEQMLSSPCHIIGTMRVKTEYVLEANDKGRMVPRKVGLAPVQRDGLEYEFTVVMDVDTGHVASASKDRTGLFDGWYDKISPDTGRKLLQWLETGRDAPEPAPMMAAVPMVPPAPKKTALDILPEKLAACTTAAEVQAIADRPLVKQALQEASEARRDEAMELFADAMSRFLGAPGDALEADDEFPGDQVAA